MHASRSLPVALVVAAMSLAACHKTPQVAPTPVAAAVDTSALRQEHVRDSLAALDAARNAANAAAMAQARADSIARANAAAQGAMRASLTEMIHFDFNMSDLRPDAQAILDAKIPILLANPNVTIQVAGNTDDRGSAEYNLALGQRRAAQRLLTLAQFNLPVDHLLFNPNNSKLFARLRPWQLLPTVARQQQDAQSDIEGSRVGLRKFDLTYVKRELIRFGYDLKLLPEQFMLLATGKAKFTRVADV